MEYGLAGLPRNPALAQGPYPPSLEQMPQGFYFPFLDTHQPGQEAVGATDLAASSFFSAGRGSFIPCYFGATKQYLFGVTVTTAAATAVVRIIVAAPDGENQMPSTVLADLGTIDASTTGLKYVGTQFPVVAGRRYWIAAIGQVAVSSVNTYSIRHYTVPAFAATNSGTAYRYTGLTGAVPGPLGTGTPEGTNYAIFAKIA